MPSPAFYQQFWQDLNQADAQEQSQTHVDEHLIQQQFLKYLTEICHHLDEKQVLMLPPILPEKYRRIGVSIATFTGHYRPKSLRPVRCFAKCLGQR